MDWARTVQSTCHRVGAGSALWRTVAVAQHAIERTALQRAPQDAADHLSDDLLRLPPKVPRGSS